MKKIEYMTPEMEVVELKNKIILLAGSEKSETGDQDLSGDDDL